MPEHQTIEWKESWYDEFLEWICGYRRRYPVQNKRDDEQDMNLGEIGIHYTRVVNWNEITAYIGFGTLLAWLISTQKKDILLIKDKYRFGMAAEGEIGVWQERSGLAIRILKNS